MRAVALAAALAFAAAPLPAALAQDSAPAKSEPATADEQYYRAFYLENGLRDFAKAVDAYERAAAAAAAAGAKDLRVKSLLGGARCLRTLGKAEEAKAAFAKALEADPANDEARAGVTPAAASPGMDPDLQDRIRGLVLSLGGPAREQASKDLALIGAPVVPFLVEGLREKEVGVVQEAAKMLALMPAEGARQALIQALGDGKVVFRRVLFTNLGYVPQIDPCNLDLLVALLATEDPGLRFTGLQAIVANNRFVYVQPDAAAPVLERALRSGDPQVREVVLRAAWNPAAIVAVLPALREVLPSLTPEPTVQALKWVGCAKDLTPEWQATLRDLLDRGTPTVQLAAYPQLEGRGLLRDGERVAVMSRFLGSEDPAVVRGAIAWIVKVPDGQPRRWTPVYVPAVLAGLRKALDGSGTDPILQDFAGLIPFASPEYPVDDVLDVVLRCQGKPRTTGFLQIENNAMEGLSGRFQGTPDPEEASAVFLKGFAALEGKPARTQWVAKWAGRQAFLTPAAVLTVATDRGQDQWIRTWAYQWIRNRAPAARPAATPALLANLGRDLLAGEQNVANEARSLADVYPDPALVPPIRTLLGRTTDDGTTKYLLRLLARCAGREAVPDLREYLLRSWDPGLRDLLVKTAGMDAVPLLVEAGGIQAVCSPSGARWQVAVPREVLEAFLDALPPGKRTGEMLRVVLGEVSGKTREALVEEALAGGDPSKVAAGAEAVRRFNMTALAPRLVPMLDDANPDVRKEAQESLESVRRYRELKATFERFGDAGPSKAFADARDLARHESPAKRRAAALALGALGDPAGVSVLLGLLDDADASVREAAMAALERLGGRPTTETK